VTNGEANSEDLTILAALEALDRGIDSPTGTPRPDELSETDTLARLYAEVMGLIPFELEPVEPAPGVRTRLMAVIHGDETQPAASVIPAIPTVSAASANRAAPVPLPAPVPLRPSQEIRVTRPASSVQGSAARRPPKRWPLALAATLSLLLLGLSGWLFLQLGQQRETIASLQQELDTERARVAEMTEEARKIQASALDMREKFSLVTSPAVEVSPMRPVGAPPPQPYARGTLFVASNHQHWFLALDGLQPAAQGKAYKLWFVADQGPVSGGSFTAQPGAPIELSSKHMPPGTKGVMVTLEDDPQAPAPAGPEILRAAAVYQIS
jgi:Anti-sigma-K factor rskA